MLLLVAVIVERAGGRLARRGGSPTRRRARSARSPASAPAAARPRASIRRRCSAPRATSGRWSRADARSGRRGGASSRVSTLTSPTRSPTSARSWSATSTARRSRCATRANAEAIDREIARLRADGVSDDDPRLRKLRELDDPDRHFLLFDPAGDGRAAEVFGDLTTARHVAVVVPGMNNDLDNFTGGDAERVQHQASQFDPDQVATIQWLGYDTPEGATALGTGRRRAGRRGAAAVRGGHPRAALRAPALDGDRPLLRLAGDRDGRVGPGPRRRRDGAGRLARRRRGPRERPRRRQRLGRAREWDLVGYSEWHGPNPHDRAFGATRFHTGDISGHSSYFNEGSESLRNIGLITAGYLDEVNVNDGLF